MSSSLGYFQSLWKGVGILGSFLGGRELQQDGGRHALSSHQPPKRMPTAGDPGSEHSGQSKAHAGLTGPPPKWVLPLLKTTREEGLPSSYLGGAAMSFYLVASSLLLRVLPHLCLSAFSISGAVWYHLKPAPTCSSPTGLASHACSMKGPLQTLFPSVPVLRGADVGSSFPGGTVVKNLPVNAGDPGSISGSGRSPGEGNSHPLQYSCLENSMDRRAWWATAHGVTESQT